MPVMRTAMDLMARKAWRIWIRQTYFEGDDETERDAHGEGKSISPSSKDGVTESAKQYLDRPYP